MENGQRRINYGQIGPKSVSRKKLARKFPSEQQKEERKKVNNKKGGKRESKSGQVWGRKKGGDVLFFCPVEKRQSVSQSKKEELNWVNTVE